MLGHPNSVAPRPVRVGVPARKRSRIVHVLGAPAAMDIQCQVLAWVRALDGCRLFVMKGEAEL